MEKPEIILLPFSVEQAKKESHFEEFTGFCKYPLNIRYIPLSLAIYVGKYILALCHHIHPALDIIIRKNCQRQKKGSGRSTQNQEILLSLIRSLCVIK